MVASNRGAAEGKRYADRGGFRNEREPPVVVVIEAAAVQLAVEAIRARMLRIFRSKHCECYLFIASNGEARLIHAMQPCLAKWLRDEFPAFVGCYSLRNGPHVLLPDIEGLMEDVRDHMGMGP